jgi:hypothetical protein
MSFLLAISINFGVFGDKFLGIKFLYFISGSKLESYFRLNWKLSVGN